MTKQKQALCNEGCGKVFAITGFTIRKLADNIEKTFFTCPHCGHEYLCFYTDPEIRRLQKQIRSVDREPVVAPHASTYISANWRHAMLQKKIKEKMAALRERIEKGERV